MVSKQSCFTDSLSKSVKVTDRAGFPSKSATRIFSNAVFSASSYKQNFKNQVTWYFSTNKYQEAMIGDNN